MSIIHSREQSGDSWAQNTAMELGQLLPQAEDRTKEVRAICDLLCAESRKLRKAHKVNPEEYAKNKIRHLLGCLADISQSYRDNKTETMKRIKRYLSDYGISKKLSTPLIELYCNFSSGHTTCDDKAIILDSEPDDISCDATRMKKNDSHDDIEEDFSEETIGQCSVDGNNSAYKYEQLSQDENDAHDRNDKQICTRDIESPTGMFGEGYVWSFTGEDLSVQDGRNSEVLRQKQSSKRETKTSVLVNTKRTYHSWAVRFATTIELPDTKGAILVD